MDYSAAAAAAAASQEYKAAGKSRRDKAGGTPRDSETKMDGAREIKCIVEKRPPAVFS